jgi:peptidoglycan/xylan/chitin deacetylase (PgdA/CDA1 family)
MSHPDLTTNSSAEVLREIQGNHKAMHELAGMPPQDLLGFRHPFLSFNERTFKSIHDTKSFRYESSLTVNPVTQGFWPFTMGENAFSFWIWLF